MAQSLEIEIKYFYEIQDELLAKNPSGGFAVIKDQNLLGVWLNRLDAIKQGIDAFGNVSFLVKNINDNPGQMFNYTRELNFTHGVPYSS